MRVALPAGVIALLSACGSSLGDHEALWAAKGPAGYHYTYGTTGFPPRFELVVTVRSRVVTNTTVLSPPGYLGGQQGFTVEELFADVRQRLDGPCKTTVQYEETLGYPRSAYSDCGMEGDGWVITDFAADLALDAGLP
jgi:hypothetical protein